MKKVLFFAVFTAFGLNLLVAQENKQSTTNEIIEKAKKGGFYIGGNIGVPLSGAGDLASFNLGADMAYLFGIIENLEVGILIGYSHFLGDGTYTYHGEGGAIVRDYRDASFIPIAASGRYYFNNRKFFGGLDTGFAINVSGDADSGLYVRPKFGFNFGAITLIGSFTSISGGSNYDEGYYGNGVLTVSGFTTANVGVEFGF